MTQPVVVVGGGPAGLAAAYRLQQHGRRVLLLERAPSLGGLAAGFRHGDYTLDFGPHRLHAATDPDVLADLHRLLGDELVLRRRRGLIHLNNRTLPYPPGPSTLFRLGPRDVLRFAAGALTARFQNPGRVGVDRIGAGTPGANACHCEEPHAGGGQRQSAAWEAGPPPDCHVALATTPDPRAPRNDGTHVGRSAGACPPLPCGSPPDELTFEDILSRRVGRPLYEAFYRPYAAKVWGLPATQIAGDQAERRVNQKGPVDLLKLALGRSASRYYYYPTGGFGRIPAAYADALARSPSVDVVCAAAVQRIEWNARGVCHVCYVVDGRRREVAAEHLVWTAPLPELLRRLAPEPPEAARRAGEDLQHRALRVFYMVLSVSRVGEMDTYYFPEAAYPFNRVMEQKNFSDAMVPPDRTVLCMDISCGPEDHVFTACDAEVAAQVAPWLERAGLARRDQVVEVFSRRFSHGYPVYRLGYRAALDRATSWLGELPNLWLAGRQGLFLHNNTHHSLLMGNCAADAIAAGHSRESWQAATRCFETFQVAD